MLIALWNIYKVAHDNMMVYFKSLYWLYYYECWLNRVHLHQSYHYHQLQYMSQFFPLPCGGTAASISSPTMQLHLLPVALVLPPVVTLHGVSETSYTAIQVPLPVAKLPVELLSNVLLLPPPAHSSNCTAKSSSAIPSVFAASRTVRVT
jgi:hypothetical protein